MNLLLTSFIQVYFVAANTLFIAKGNYTAVFICSFAISFVWTLNVKKVAFGNMKDRIIYATGAALGGVCGLLTANLI